MRIPSLTALRAFEAAARLGSFTAAADELSVSQSAVSQQIRALEEDLGIALFRRTGPRIALTPEGAALGDGLGAGFAGIQRAVEAVRRRLRPVVTVSLLPTYAVRWLIPRLERFSAAHPGIDIRLATAVEPELPDGSDVDAAIVSLAPGGFRDPGLVADLLFEDSVFPVCRPGFVAGRAAKAGRADLAALVGRTLLHVDAPARAGDWAAWLRGAAAAGGEAAGIDARAGIRFDNSTQAIQAALSGVGVAIGHYPFVIDDVRAGQLAAPFAHVERSGRDFMLVCRADALARPGVAAFRDWLLGEAATLREEGGR
jgi:DNA-binding transcriptional LysR family regulator